KSICFYRINWCTWILILKMNKKLFIIVYKKIPENTFTQLHRKHRETFDRIIQCKLKFGWLHCFLHNCSNSKYRRICLFRYCMKHFSCIIKFVPFIHLLNTSKHNELIFTYFTLYLPTNHSYSVDFVLINNITLFKHKKV